MLTMHRQRRRLRNATLSLHVAGLALAVRDPLLTVEVPMATRGDTIEARAIVRSALLPVGLLMAWSVKIHKLRKITLSNKHD